ncbi:MAG: LysR family transcriptional regulator [Magnetospirillum sp.]|nr:LysR family transcriptional regulator [Magnetospirillum sp.]
MDRLEAMTLLVEVVEAGSFTAAARRLGMPLATISRKIGALEEHLKARLLHRTTRRLFLSDAGQAYVAACRHILEQVGEAERIAAGEYAVPRGTLVMTAPIVFGRLHVLPVVVEFLDAFADIDVEMVFSDRSVHLLDDHIDLAIRIGHLPDSRLVALRLGAVRPVTCASPAYLGSRGRPSHPQELLGHDCIAFETLSPPRLWTFADGSAEMPVSIHPRLVVNTAEAAVDAARAGMGITQVLSYQIDEARRAGELEIVLDGFAPAVRPVSLVHAGQGILPLKLRAFLDFAAPRLGARLAAMAA